MGIRKFDEMLTEDVICCPRCKGHIIKKDEFLVCQGCAAKYPLIQEIPVMLSEESISNVIKKDIQQFWGELYDAAYADSDESMDKREFLNLLSNLEKMFQKRRHLAVTEMPIKNISGMEILDVGSGAGAHLALLALHGAKVIATDITFDRVVATKKKLAMIDNSDEYFALQADAEELPFRDDSFDIVFSNGVLHHLPNTDTAIGEIFRVLKPNGKAIIMIYAKHSFYYWIGLFLYQGIIRGNLFRHPNYLGRVTEWMSQKKRTADNPITKVFTGKDIKSLFHKFEIKSIRKNGFEYENTAPYVKDLLLWLSRKNRRDAYPGGILVYGRPYIPETPLELRLGNILGFCLNIVAVKSSKTTDI